VGSDPDGSDDIATTEDGGGSYHHPIEGTERPYEKREHTEQCDCWDQSQVRCRKFLYYHAKHPRTWLGVSPVAATARRIAVLRQPAKTWINLPPVNSTTNFITTSG
jgi:hypothetical protein